MFSYRYGYRSFLSALLSLSFVMVTGPSATAQGPIESPLIATADDATLLAQVSPAATVEPASFNEAAGNSGPSAEVTKEIVARELELVDAAPDLADDAKAGIKEHLKEATEWIDAEAALEKRQAEIEAELPNIPKELEKIRKSLNEFSDAEFQASPSGESIAELEGQLASLRQQVEADEAQLRGREKEVEERTERLNSLAKEAIDLEQRIGELTKQVAAPEPAGIEGRSQRLEMRARLSMRKQELEVAKLERRRLEGIAELLPLQRDLAKRVLRNRQAMLARWEKMIDVRRKEESRHQAAIARRKAANSHPALKSLAEQNALIAEQRMKTAAEIQRLTDLIKSLNNQSDQIDDDFNELSDRVEHAGTTSTTGLLLRKKRSELPDDNEYRSRAEWVQQTMPDAHLQLLEWKRLRREVADPGEAAQEIVGSLDASLAEFDQEQVISVIDRLMTDRRELLDKAIPDQDTYLQDLNELELVNQRLSDQVAEFRQYLNQRVLWIRSTDFISPSDWREARDGLAFILSPARWRETMRVGGVSLLKHPAIGIGLVAIVVLLVLFRTRLRAYQEYFSQPLRDDEPANFGHHLAAFAISVLMSARWPALVLAIGLRLKVAADASTWSESVGNALITCVAFLWGCELIREFCRADGVGQRLFDWPATATQAVRCKLEPVLIAGAPLITMLLLAEHGDVDSMQSLQRVLFITIMAMIGIQLAQLTRPKGALMHSLAECSETSWIVRGRYLIWMAAAGVPLAFVALSMTGYHFSAYQLSKHLGETGAALIGIIALHAVSLAWLKALAHNRRLHDQAARDEAARDEAAREEAAGVGPANELVSRENELRSAEADTEDHEQYLPTAAAPQQSHEEKVNQEVRDLLRYACVLLMGVGGWLIWSEVFPALRVFDNVVLWQSIESVAETVVDASGTEAIRVVDHYVPTTLTDLLLAGLICLATWMIGRRLPGMVELALFSKLPFEHGGRQAMGIIIGYLASAAGFILACKVIHLSWSSVQWLAAAMTVGLGFGLQEIFANLVSGLIILVERPIRVGDIVSVGDVTGTVSRMKMRATTVTDWDRRELIVPNKKFITDNVINWSLSDPISRIVLPVGVAYGTDINRVRRILLRIAAECPHVLKDPAPNTLFKGFGDSTLNVQLMVFIPERRVYIDVVNELNCAIAREFTRAKISIAFPQLDLHIDPKDFREAFVDAKREDLHVA